MKNKNVSKMMKERWKDSKWITKMRKIHKGKIMSKESREKMSKAHSGKKLTEEHKRKIGLSKQGKKTPKDTIDKIRKANTGKKHSKETKEKLRKLNLGKKNTKETKKKMSKSRKKYLGNNTPNGLFKKDNIPWNKGKKINKKPWNYIDGRSKNKPNKMRYGCDWKKIRNLIYERDNYICQECGITMEESKKKFKQQLHVHHIIPFEISKDNSIDNLITLCASCHKKEEDKINRKLKLYIRGVKV